MLKIKNNTRNKSLPLWKKQLIDATKNPTIKKSIYLNNFVFVTEKNLFYNIETSACMNAAAFNQSHPDIVCELYDYRKCEYIEYIEKPSVAFRSSNGWCVDIVRLSSAPRPFKVKSPFKTLSNGQVALIIYNGNP